MASARFSFRVLDAANAADRETWRTVWDSWPGREVFANPEYVALFSGTTSEALCAMAIGDGKAILYPFLLRELSGGGFPSARFGEATDITSPYGYGGPFQFGDPGPQEVSSFWGKFSTWAGEHGVVSEFLRLSLFEDSRLPYPGLTVESGSNVVRSLTLDATALWMDVEHKVRKNVKKAVRSGVEIEVDRHGDRLDTFMSVYYATMDRRGAHRSYYFTKSFFDRLRTNLDGSYCFFHAILDGVVVSTELALVSAENVYSFLGGTDPIAFSVRPNDLLKYRIVEWARDQGKQRFILGGGYRADDSIYRYKLSFAPNGRVPFNTGQRIFDRHAYDEAIATRRSAEIARTGSQWEPRADYFPAYRS